MDGFSSDPRLQSSQKKKQSKGISWNAVVIVILAVATIVNIALFYMNYTNSQIPPKTNQELADEVITSFGQIFNVPSGDQPAVIIITDIDKLRESEATFYKDAVNGDHIIIIESTRLAVIYRKSENKIINAATITIDQNAEGTEQTDDETNTQDQTNP